MTRPTDYRPGMNVENSYGARGKVVSVQDNTVTVDYSARGGTWTSKHDEAWFKKYPLMLPIIEVWTRARGAA